jgi:hypothetical protein
VECQKNRDTWKTISIRFLVSNNGNPKPALEGTTHYVSSKSPDLSADDESSSSQSGFLLLMRGSHFILMHHVFRLALNFKDDFARAILQKKKRILGSSKGIRF